MSSDTPVRLEVDGAVALVTLSRPERRNTIDLPTAQGLLDVALRCSADAEIRAVLLRGEGSTFCAGGDLNAFAAEGKNLPQHLREVTTALHAAIGLLARLDAPLVVAVQGAAAGAGLGLAALGDVVVAATSAKFVFAYTALGLSPDAGTSWSLPRLVGLRLATDMALTGRALSADEALAAGLVSRVVADADLGEHCEQLAVRLAVGPTPSFGSTKRLLRDGLTAPLPDQLDAEGRRLSELAATGDGIEGLAAFLDKRVARFTGV